MKRFVYITGPIAGMPNDNREAFSRAQYEIDFGDASPNPLEWMAVNPHLIPPWNHEGSCPRVYGKRPDTVGHDGGCHLREDIARLVRCHAIYRLKGWEHSRGAKIEVELAEKLGLEIWDEK